MKKTVIIMSLLLAGIPVMSAQDTFEDDIYFNPKNEKKQAKKSNYIANIADMDVDTYNLGGMMTPMPTDTIGLRTENGEDFVYTQQIQKYYNPTIVVDNADLLADILNNSYGNVDVVINNGIVGFAPYNYGWPYYSWSPYYSYSPWGWNFTWGSGWGWNIGLGWYDPWYAWSPGWGWGWTWGPGWGWDYPGWGGPAWGGPVRYADYTPHGNHRVGASGNWASNTRPGGNYSDNRYSMNRTPGYGSATNNHRASRYNNSGSNSHRVYSGGYNPGSFTDRTSTQIDNNRRRATTTNRNSYNNNRGTVQQYKGNTQNQRRSYTNSTRSYNSGNSGVSGFGGGSHRSSGGGGGGGRGHRR